MPNAFTEYTFRLPSPPSTNNLFVNRAGKGRVRTERYRIWAEAASWAMKVEDGKARGWLTLPGPVAVEIVVGNPKLDIDNSAKSVLDLLVSMNVLLDDDQVVDLRILRGAKSREATVTVRPLPHVVGEAA